MDTPNPFHLAFAAADEAAEMTPAARRRMYDRARAGLAEAIEADPDPAAARAFRKQARALESGVRALEAEIRARRALRPEIRSPRADPAGDALFPCVVPPVRPRRPRPSLAAGLLRRSRQIEALVWRNAKATAAGGPFAYLWLVVEPGLLIGFVMAFYILLGRAEIFDMPAPAFVALGVGGWFIYRSIFLRLSAGLGGDLALLRLPPVTEADLFAARALFYLTVYVVMLSGFMAALMVFDMAEPPAAPLAAAGWIACLAAIGFSHGVAFCLAAQVFPPIARIKMVLMRALYVLSGAMFVTEQFPDPVSEHLLWNPLLHCVQLLRSAYFAGYDSEVVSARYALGFALVSGAVGALCLRALSRAPKPA